MQLEITQQDHNPIARLTDRSERVNGLDMDALSQVVEAVRQDPAKGVVEFRVASAWKGQTRSESTVESYRIGGQEVRRRFSIPVDEPLELLGENTAPNPQEMLLTALNACMIVGYVASAAVKGITLENLEIETAGELHLRGFLGLGDPVVPGYEQVRYTVRIKGNGTPDEFQEIHDTVMRTAPNYFNVSRPISLESTLEVQA